MTLIAEIHNSQIQDLRDRVSALEEQVAVLLDLSRVEVVELRDIGREQAKSEIVELFGTTKGHLYFSDIQAKLGIDYDMVVEICQELIDEGAIGLDANAL